MYNTIYNGREIADMLRRIKGSAWVTGYKEDAGNVHVAGEWFPSRGTCVSGPVWCSYFDGARKSEYTAPKSLIKISVTDMGYTDYSNIRYIGNDSGQMMFMLPGMCGLSGVKLIDDRFRVITRVSDSPAAFSIFGRLGHGGDFIHKRNSNLFHYARSLVCSPTAWIGWSNQLMDFYAITGRDVLVTFKMRDGVCVGVTDDISIVPIGFEDGEYSVTVPDGAFGLDVYVTPSDVSDFEGVAGYITPTEVAYKKMEEDTYRALADEDAWSHIINLLLDIQEKSNVDSDDYILRSVLVRYLDELTSREEQNA